MGKSRWARMGVDDVKMVVCHGNLEALDVMKILSATADSVDPVVRFSADECAISAGCGHVYDFDRMGIFGSRISRFFNQLAGGDAVTAHAIFRAIDKKIITEQDVITRLDAEPVQPFDKAALVAQVRERYPAFAPDNASKSAPTYAQVIDIRRAPKPDKTP